MPRLIDRYLLRGLVAPFLIALLIFTFILLVPYLVQLVEPLVAKGVAPSVIAKAMALLLPMALATTIPIALLIALLVALGRMSADREWVALQACGVSLYRLLWPIGAASVVAWAMTSWVLIWGVPGANQMYREIQYNVLAERAEGEVQPRVFFEKLPHWVLYARDVPESGGGWNDVFLADTTDPEAPVLVMARRGRMLANRAKRTVELVLDDATQHRVDAAKPDTYTVSRFEQLVLSVDPSSIFPDAGPAKGDREKTIAELEATIAENRRTGVSTHNAIMAIHKKFSIPVACFVFGLLALVLGLTTRRDGRMASFVIGVGVVFAYYVLMMMSEQAAKGAKIPAHLAMWVPNVALGIPGIVLLTIRGSRASAWRRRAGNALSGLVGRVFPRRTAGADTEWQARPRGGASAAAAFHTPWWRRILPRPSLLDTYVARLYLRVATLSFAALIGIFYISTFIDLSDKLFKGKTTGAVLGQYLWYETPQFVYYCIPLAVLIGAMVTVGLLTRSSELIVMRACGISLYRSALPLVLAGVAASAVLFLFDENVLAYSNRRAAELRHQIRVGTPRTFDVLVNRQWLAGKNGDIYHYVYFDAVNGQLNKFTRLAFAPKAWRIQSRTFFETVTYRGAAGADPNAVVSWDARSGWTREFDRQTESRGFRAIAGEAVPLEAPAYFAAEQPDNVRMRYRELRHYIDVLRAAGFSVVKQQVALHQKISFPWVTVVMTLIAIPFAVSTGRKGALYGIGIGVALALVYWVTTSVFAAIGQTGAMSPMLAAWAPNMIFGAFAAYLLLTVRT